MCAVVSSIFFFSSRRRHTRLTCDWSSDVCSSDLDSAARALYGSGCGGDATEDRGESAGRLRGERQLERGLGARRSEERRVGKECRARWAVAAEKKTRQHDGQAGVRGIRRDVRLTA